MLTAEHQWLDFHGYRWCELCGSLAVTEDMEWESRQWYYQHGSNCCVSADVPPCRMINPSTMDSWTQSYKSNALIRYCVWVIAAALVFITVLITSIWVFS